MDELFGTADFSKVEDVGVAAQHARVEDPERREDIHLSDKV
jgi:hypothetical protein